MDLKIKSLKILLYNLLIENVNTPFSDKFLTRDYFTREFGEEYVILVSLRILGHSELYGFRKIRILNMVLIPIRIYK